MKSISKSELGKEMKRRRIYGRNFEYRVRKWYEKQGYYVRRAYASAFPDLLVARHASAFFVEVKTNLKYFSKSERIRFAELWRVHGLPGYVAYKDEKKKIRIIKIIG